MKLTDNQIIAALVRAYGLAFSWIGGKPPAYSQQRLDKRFDVGAANDD